MLNEYWLQELASMDYVKSIAFNYGWRKGWQESDFSKIAGNLRTPGGPEARLADIVAVERGSRPAPGRAERPWVGQKSRSPANS
jgi:hypothetical protein